MNLDRTYQFNKAWLLSVLGWTAALVLLILATVHDSGIFATWGLAATVLGGSMGIRHCIISRANEVMARLDERP